MLVQTDSREYHQAAFRPFSVMQPSFLAQVFDVYAVTFWQ
jgi:hypothetical protein